MSLYFPKLDLSLVKRPPRNAETKFPCKLYRMLSDVEKQGMAHIVSWHDDGKCFRIHDPEAFAEKILPSYFKKCKFRSFQRQLNLYGFQRITAIKPFWESCYFHEGFSRNVEDGCKTINRPMKSNSGKNNISHDDYDIDENVPSMNVDNVDLEFWSDKPDSSSQTLSRTFGGTIESAAVQRFHEKVDIMPGYTQAPTGPAQSIDQEDTFNFDVPGEYRETHKSKVNDINEEELFEQIDGRALTRRNSYKDLCESILGPDCPVCKDGENLVSDVLGVTDGTSPRST